MMVCSATPSGVIAGVMATGIFIPRRTSTAMASNPDKGVCDQNLKVFGLENLYVVSNSVFPHMGANPPTLTIAALALRLASHLEGETVL